MREPMLKVYHVSYQVDSGKTLGITIKYGQNTYANERLQMGGFASDDITKKECCPCLTREQLIPRHVKYGFPGRKKPLKIYFQNKQLFDDFIADPEHRQFIHKVVGEVLHARALFLSR